MLCRIRKKCNNSTKSTWELDRNFSSHEQNTYFPRSEYNHDHDNHDYQNQTCSKSSTITTPTPQNLETMIIDYLYKDFPMLPYLFATTSQPNPLIPCIEKTASTSTVSFQSGEIVNPRPCGTSSTLKTVSSTGTDYHWDIDQADQSIEGVINDHDWSSNHIQYQGRVRISGPPYHL